MPERKDGPDDGFLRRWSRRKQEHREGLPDSEPAAPPPEDAGAVKVAPEAEAGAIKPLTEEDFADVDWDALDAGSDYGRFLAKGVPESIRQKALGKLWLSDPVYSQAEALDMYMEDFSDAAKAVSVLKTLHRVGKGFLTDEEIAAWDRLGKSPAELAAADAADKTATAAGLAARSATDEAPPLRNITAAALKPRLTAGPEIAFIDVREAGQHGEGHPFLSINVPYSRLELDIERLLPRKSIEVVLLDEGDGIAERAARRLAALGYGNVARLEGGAAAWAAAGFTLFKGVNVPSKAFGEIVEHAHHVPSLSAEELSTKVAAGERLVILDGRTPAEYRRMTIPGACSCPNAELPHRIGALVADPATTIVVNCAGRTRSIIGAQNLRQLGLPNPVIALRNGTQGWLLAGLELQTGNEPAPPATLGAAGLAQSRARADALIGRHRLARIDRATLARWQADAARTLYLLDVRTAEEFAAGHWPGSAHAPGGQLVQATDQWVGARGARIVLADDTGLRAATTAIWLAGMGHDVHILAEDVSAASPRESGPGPAPRGPAPLSELAAKDLAGELARGAVLIDLAPGMTYRKGHIEGARWANRARLDRLGLAKGTRVVLAAEDPQIAALAALDLTEAGMVVAGRLAGGSEEWKAAGLRLTATPDVPAQADCIDYLFFVHDRHEGNLDAARGYLAWEIGLVGQMDEQERGLLRPLM